MDARALVASGASGDAYGDEVGGTHHRSSLPYLLTAPSFGLYEHSIPASKHASEQQSVSVTAATIAIAEILV